MHGTEQVMPEVQPLLIGMKEEISLSCHDP